MLVSEVIHARLLIESGDFKMRATSGVFFYGQIESDSFGQLRFQMSLLVRRGKLSGAASGVLSTYVRVIAASNPLLYPARAA